MFDLKNKNSITIIALVIVCLILTGALIYFQFIQKTEKNSAKIEANKVEEKNNVKVEENVISSEKAATLALAYINENILKGKAQMEFVGEPKEESGLYKLQGKMGGQEFFTYITKDGKLFFAQGFNVEEDKLGKETSQEKPSEKVVLGDFSVTQNEVCKEGDKPIVYFFGSAGCPHCVWEKPVIEKVAENFKEHISFHKNIDSNNDSEIFTKYSAGGVPTLVLGCKYYREGSGERDGEDKETKNLTALICKLTENQPKEVCAAVQDLIDKI
ncbi:thioredoxin family protein [Patescibacteria group bacterium]|nr:thioredoxin family protein [Patescibacteria group bacterium]